MKKIWNFMRSMRFGVILLVLIAVLCLPGSVIQQGAGRTAMTVEYGETWGGIIDTLGLNRVFSTWYFAALFVMLCLNLLLCSVVRLGSIKKLREAFIARAERKTDHTDFDAAALRGIGKRELTKGTWFINGIGFYGSFMTHLGMLLLFISAALVFSLQDAHDLTVKVGETGTVPDGTAITVNAFDMKNVSGETDYISHVTLTRPGKAPEELVIRVNEPIRFGNYTVYQQSYNMNAAEVELWTEDNPEPDTLTLEGPVFLSLDDENGIAIRAIYSDYEIDEDGQIAVRTTLDGSLIKPCYLTATVENGVESTGVVLPGTTITAGGVYVRFPDYYPVFNVKYLPNMLMPLMYVSFLLLIAGLYLCFFAVPKIVTVRGNKMTLTTMK